MNSQSYFAQAIALIAIATLFPLSGCNPFQNTPEAPKPKESSSVTVPTTPNPWEEAQLLHSLATDSTPIIAITISPDGKTLVASRKSL